MRSTKRITAVLLTGGLVLVTACSPSGDDGVPADDDATTTTAAEATTTTAAEATTMTTAAEETPASGTYVVVGTDQTVCYDDTVEIACPSEGEAFYGQDANYPGTEPAYEDNGDGTVTDVNTGLMWQQDPGDKTTYSEAAAGADSFSLAGYDDWRLPTIKELYSLILFSGVDIPPNLEDTSDLTPFIDTDFFVFEYGDTSAGQRLIDSQWTTSTVYESTVFGGQECFFGVNFADGRIKCYPTSGPNAGFFTIYVRGASDYGENSYIDNGDGTVTDDATGLTWQQADNGEGIDWPSALSYCEALDVGGNEDWRLPNAKELQSIVDYSKSPDTTDSAAIDSVFGTSSITNEGGVADFPTYWTSTTHVSYPDNGSTADYIAFGRSLGFMNGEWIDVHGAGSQRSDPKIGDAADFPTGRGPQGDAIRIDNYVRCVRDA